MKLYYRKTGSGPAIVILHGLYGSSDNWVSIARELNDRFTVYLPDLRNHGQSPHHEIHTYDSMSEDLFEMMSGEGVGKFILAGHSMGGKAAMKYSLRWPESLNSLVVVDISPFGTGDPENAFYRQHSTILEAILSTDPEGTGKRAEVDSRLSVKIPSERIRSFIMKNLARDSNNRFYWKLNARSLYDNLDNIMEGVVPAGKIRDEITGFPVHFIRGELSDYISEDEIPQIRRIFPAADFTTVKNAGHWIHSERPDAIIKILREQGRA